MIYSETMRRAVRFAITTHEVNQQQKRKGKKIAYITHPLTVGLILTQAGADEQTIVAGLLHDTVEDSTLELPVTVQTLETEFGPEIASLIASVTELPKSDEWHVRKTEALNRVATYSNQSVLVKSADVQANDWELIDDISAEGDSVFDRFNVSSHDRLQHQLRMIEVLLAQWPESPLAGDLRILAGELTIIESRVSARS